MALGCTIGQAHHRRLHAGARLVPHLAAIVAGGFWGLRVLERQIMASA